MNGFVGGASRFQQWFSGSIRRKLTLFVVLICLMLVSLFWALSIFMLQPSYNRLIRNDLTIALNAVVDVLNHADAGGLEVLITSVSPEGTTTVALSPEILILLRQEQQNGALNLNGRCLDISGQNLQNFLLSDALSPRCLLHQSHEGGITPDGVDFISERNGALATLLRAKIANEGYYYGTLEGGQMVMGATAAGGRFIVMISANLERIPQATRVLDRKSVV